MQSKSIIFSITLLLFIPSVVRSQCPLDASGYRSVVNNRAFNASAPYIHADPDEIYDFIGPGGCTGIPYGPNPPTQCLAFRSSYEAGLQANWPLTASNTTANGCTFNCDGGTCRVRGGDALPVELMEFSVEDEDSPGAIVDDPEAPDEEA